MISAAYGFDRGFDVYRTNGKNFRDSLEDTRYWLILQATVLGSFIIDDQEDVAVAGLASGGFVVAWESYLQDGDGQGVFGQAFADEMCGDATGDARYTASDALLTLRTAVGSGACVDCVCDVNGSGATNATDALIVLRVAVGQAIPLLCTPC